MSSLPLILASASPRRRELLRELGIAFQVANAEVAELEALSPEAPKPADLAIANARLKATTVARSHPGSSILGADTVVYLDLRVHRRISSPGVTTSETHRTETRILGKPREAQQARQFLRALSGQTHEVVTACVLLGPDGKENSLHEISRVTFRTLTEDDIARYLAAVHVMDKAGAYALQEHGDWIIASVEGSRTNVIGLPMEKLADLLRPWRGTCDGLTPPLQS